MPRIPRNKIDIMSCQKDVFCIMASSSEKWCFASCANDYKFFTIFDSSFEGHLQLEGGRESWNCFVLPLLEEKRFDLVEWRLVELRGVI